jgi:hypothetical protein
MTAVTTLNKFGQFERMSQMFTDITCKSFAWIPWPCTFHWEIRGLFISTKHMRMEYTRIMFCGNSSLCRLASLVWMEFNEVKQTTGSFFRTVRESLNALIRLHVMAIRDFFFNFNWNITNSTFALSMTQIIAIDEWEKFRKRSKLHRCCYFEPLFYPAVMMFEEVHMLLILCRQKRIYITFTSYLTEMCEKTCIALQ